MSEQQFIQGDDLVPYQQHRTGKCWWCGSSASTREHKFKRTDLARMQDGGEDLVWGDGDSLKNIRSVRKSTMVKFAPNLCAACNNDRSQAFDMAYDRFAEYVWDRRDELWRSRNLDMRLLYGGNWPSEVLNLARYVTKHIGCRMDDNGYQVPNEFAPFLNGGALLPNVQMVLFKDPIRWAAYQQTKHDDPVFGLWMSPALGEVSRSRGKLVMYSSALIIGYVGVMYRWNLDVAKTDPFYLYRRARLHRRDRLPAY